MKIINNSYVITPELHLANDWSRVCQERNRVFVAVLTKARSKYVQVHYDTYTKEACVSDALNLDGISFVLHLARHYKSAFEFCENNGWFSKMDKSTASELAQDLSTLFLLPSIFTSCKVSYDQDFQKNYDADVVKDFLERIDFVKSFVGA